ncbi:MAG: helix-turn-helix transcriptional regulator [Alicyclobacillaceae bacterium]|nr:helix-turn-helix transcriptional regulator [Alicyclobacillaceae bacterium]
MEIGTKIATLRRELGLTQAKLAQLAHVSTSAVAMYETNRRQPDDQVLTQIATALHVSPSELTSGTDLTASRYPTDRTEKMDSQQEKSTSATSDPAAKSKKEVSRSAETHSNKKTTAGAVDELVRSHTETTDRHEATSLVEATAHREIAYTAASEESSASLTTLTLTQEEARIILFTRMNPRAMPFLQDYIRSDGQKRESLEKAWKLIHEFQR